MKRTCGFCGAHLDEAAPQPKTRRVQAKIVAPRADSGPDRRKVVLIGLLLALVGVVAAVIFFTGGGEATPDYPPDEACRRTMILLDFSLQEYVAAGHAPPGTLGSQFWLTVVEEKGGPKRLKCPAGGGKGRMSDYRGPAKPYKELPNDGIIAATYPGDHPGGINVLLKNGTVLVAATDGELFKRAMAETKE